MERIRTQINGISTVPSHKDGDCISLVNLRPVNGVLKPISDRKVLHTLNRVYDMVFIHQTKDYENWIGVVHLTGDDAGKSTVYARITEDEPAVVATTPAVGSIQQTGNTLSLITADEIYYLLYDIYSQQYSALGVLPEIPPVFISISDSQFSEKSGGWKDEDPLNEFTAGYNEIYSEIKEKGIATGQDAGKIAFFDSHLVVCALILHDGSTVRCTPPRLICNNLYDTAKYFIKDGDNDHVDVWYYRASINLNPGVFYKWRDVVKSIGIFLSPGLGYNTPANFVSEFTIHGKKEPYPAHRNRDNLLKDQSTMIANMKTESNFYLVDSVESFVSNTVTVSLPDRSKIISLENLPNLQRLEWNTTSHNITGDVAYTYNHRLHIGNVKTKLFSGFNVKHFKINNTAFNGIENDLKYNFPLTGSGYIAVEVKIRTDEGVKSVYSYHVQENSFLFIDPYFSYPDSRAFEADIFYTSGSIYSISSRISLIKFKLTSHNFLNIAYHIFTDESGTRVIPPVKENYPEVSFPNPMEVFKRAVYEREEGKLKVSESGNPFVFPNKNTYTVGNGAMLALSTIATRIPEGSYGQYPLYVFTERGIYALSTGTGDVLYASQSTPTSYEVPACGVVCNTPFGVVFVSLRGICIISGQDVTLLMPQLPVGQAGRTPSVRMNPDESLKLSGITAGVQEDMHDFVKKIKFIAYNSIENEFIVKIGDCPYNLCYCFDSKQAYYSTCLIDSPVENSFPDLLTVSGYDIKDFAYPGTDSAQVSLLTRPLLYGTTDTKRLERVIMRATLLAGNDALQPDKVPSAEQTQHDSELNGKLSRLSVLKRELAQIENELDSALNLLAWQQNNMAVKQDKADEDRQQLDVEQDVLDGTKAELDATQAQLESDRTQLEAEQAQMAADRVQMEADRVQLEENRATLEEKFTELIAMEEEFIELLRQHDLEQEFQDKNQKDLNWLKEIVAVMKFQFEADASRMESLQSQINSLNSSVSSLQSTVSSHSSNISSLNSSISSLNSSISSLNSSISSLNSSISNLNSRINSLQNQINNLS